MYVSPITVLLVEDNPADVYLTRHVLAAMEGPAVTLEAVERLSAALARLERGGIDAVLLDLSLPDSDGLETFRRLRQEVDAVAIVVLTGLEDEATALNAVRLGAQDYLVKGKFNGPLLSRALRYAMERQRLQLELRALSLTDELTGLTNRRGFFALAAEDLRQARRNREELVVGFADLDGLKVINDTLGHEEGDRAIRDAADVLRQTFRDSDLIARMGGDEFIVLLRHAGPDTARRAEERLRARLQEHAALGRRYQLGVSLGFVRMAAADDLTLETIVSAADRAMYRKKALRKEAVRAG